MPVRRCIPLLMLMSAWANTAETPVIPAIEQRDRLGSWDAGVAAADARERPLQVVCIGDSNTEMDGYVVALRRMLQSCYGERGIGYWSLGERTDVPQAPRITRRGTWQLLRDAPKAPPPPYFALDGIWCQTSDAQAELEVAFAFGAWQQPAQHLARAYNGQQRVRIHHQVGPDLGSFTVSVGGAERLRIDCRAEVPGYAVSEAFLADGFRIADISDRIVLFGIDTERVAFLQGKPVLAGGALVHALGKSWGRTEEPARLDESAYAAFFRAIRPDLITIMLGTNDQHNDGRVASYSGWLTTIVQRLQQHSPGTGILIIACPENAQTKPGLAETFRDAARAVADAHGCAFWSLQDLVGPRSTAWYREGLYQDGLHYSPIGGDLIARLLLRQLDFDLQDPRHYAVLRADPPAPAQPTITIPRLSALTLDAVATALAPAPAHTVWRDDVPIATLRFAVAGSDLAVHAQVVDGQCAGDPASWTGGVVEVSVADPQRVGRVMHNQEGPIVRQVVVHAVAPAEGAQAAIKQFTMDEDNTVIPWQSDHTFPFRHTARDEAGYDLVALIPLAELALRPDQATFLLEAAVVAAPARGGPADYNRLFAVQPDGGAFRDVRGSARVVVAP